MNFSIYELDDNIRQLLTLDNFLGDLTIEGFIEELSKDHSLKGAEVNKLEYLDPKPYIRTFESTLRELKQLTEESTKRKTKSEKDVEAFEIQHSNNILKLSSRVDFINNKFSTLDQQISTVSSTVTPLGEQLTKLTNSRDRSKDTIFLINCYRSFYNDGKCKELEKLRTSGNFQNKAKCARTVKQLITLSQKVQSEDVPGSITCVDVIEKYSEVMERELLDLFNDYYRDFKFDFMKSISGILFEFNGGANVIQLFVNQHEFFIDTKKFDDNGIFENDTIWNNLSDPDYREVVNDDNTIELLDAILTVIRGEARIVNQVFDSPVQVLQIFITRIYAQIIQTKVASLLQFAISISQLAFFRLLHSLYLTIGNFTKDLKDFLIANELDNDNELNNILDQCYLDIFIEYISDNKYFVKEKKNLQEIIYQTISRFEIMNEKATKDKNLSNRLENLENDIVQNNNKLDDGHDKKRIAQITKFMKNKLERHNSSSSKFHLDNALNAKKNEEILEYKHLNINKVETILKSAIESLARILELSPSKIPEHALEILEILLLEIGKSYIDIGLEIAYNSTSQDYKSDIDFSYLSIIHTTSEILYLFSSCVQKIIIPSAMNSPNIKKRMNDLTNSYITRCELSLNVIIQDTIEMVLNKTAHYLTKQKKKDFLGENIIEDDTEACEDISNFLPYMYEQVVHYLNDNNLNKFLISIGKKFLNQLLEHFKKFQVNSTGALILTKDIIRYQSIIEEWKIPELTEEFQLLKEVSNLFTVQPDLLSSLIKEGQLASMKPYVLRQYIGKRADFNSNYIERFFSFKS